MKVKSIKDAIHGYIQLKEPFWRIIDTAEFQRLKWIEQTSYRVLYPSARHDRFIHSIGVCHLGQKAVEGFYNNSTKEDKCLIDDYKNTFLLACLVHDIGHAPFSHTCEELYNYKQVIDDINSNLNTEFLEVIEKELSEEQKYASFLDDYKFTISPNGKAPSEHEVMSCIVVCKKFKEFASYFPEGEREKLDLELLIRAIIGCCYKATRNGNSDENRKIGIKNCLIRLLNSTTVDVDKLDYIARDTQMSGYDNTVLDTERLLGSVCMICQGNVYFPAFKKSALSVISNVVLAKNAQAKWIVNHPIVLYDGYLLKSAIGETLRALADSVASKKRTGKKKAAENKTSTYDDLISNIFSYKSISKGGNKSVCGHNFTLLSDVEILNLMKDNIKSSAVSEYFARNERRGPVWKSYEEFLYCLESDIEKAKCIYSFIVPLITHLDKVKDISNRKKIDDKLYEEVKNADAGTLEGRDDILAILDVFKGYEGTIVKDVAFDYVILSVNKSFYSKLNAKNLFIRFGDREDAFIEYAKLVALTDKESEKQAERQVPFFYLYSKDKIDAKHFLAYLYEQSHMRESVRL